MDRPRARWMLLVALAIGVLADLVLDGSAPGLNLLIVIGIMLLAAWRFRREGRAPDPLDTWLPATAVLLAAFVAIRADPFLAVLDTLGALAFTGASAAAFSGLAVTRRSASVVMTMGAWVVAVTLFGALRMHRAARRDPAEPRPGAPTWLAPVGRGLLLAVPLALMMATLFASADPIFRRGLADLLGVRFDLGDLPGRAIFAVSFGWFAAGLLAVAGLGIPDVARAASLGAAVQTAARSWERILGATEAVVVLLAVDAVAALFVGLQVGYLFGGLDTLAAIGMTYSDYARRGYFELVAAAGLAGGILVGLDLAIVRRPAAYLGLALTLVGLTVAVLVSAAVRLGLYQAAYGWTELRLYVAVSIVALAVTLLVLAVLLARDRARWLGHAMAVIGLVSLIGLNVLAPAAFVAERNLARAIDPSLVPLDGESGLDAAYLEVLPDDAVPALVAALPALPAEEAAAVRQLLDRRARALGSDPSFRASPPGTSVGSGRATPWRVLSASEPAVPAAARADAGQGQRETHMLQI